MAVMIGLFAGVLLEGVAILDRGRQAVQPGKGIKCHSQGLRGLAKFAYFSRVGGCEIDSARSGHLVIMIACGLQGGNKGVNRMRRIYSVLVLALLLAGCETSPRRTTGSSGGGGSTGGQLYVSTASSILRFSDAESSNGNVAPVATMTGLPISSPQHMFLDTAANRLYVANQGGSSILVYDNASTLTGTSTPTRVISGNATTLVAPFDVAVDTGNNLLYVADGTSIHVFASASTIIGNTPPVRNINMGITIGGLFLDAARNQLYVSDPADNAVDRLDGASSQDVVGIVGGAIAGPDTKLAQPRGLALDAAG